MSISKYDSFVHWNLGSVLLSESTLGLLANLKSTREVKGACQVEATSITTVFTSLSAMDGRDRPLKN